MKKLFIVANWKSNKTIKETEKWLHDFSDGFNKANIKLEDKKIIIAPPFTSLEHAHYCSGNLELSLEFAAQDVSPFRDGAYTGEVSAKQIKELADYVIVGHSERRKDFGEDEEMVNQKLEQSLKQDLTPILCVSNLKQIHNSTLRLRSGQEFIIHNSNCIVAYEPLSAIGSGHPDTPENADTIAQKVKKELGETPVLYGGSVTSGNVKSFTSMSDIDGVLVGGASLDPLEFLKIIKNA
jgi:triosephosphate isomerase